MQLKNKIAIVTGASEGLGYAISKALTEKGTTVFGLARRKEKLEQAAAELGELFQPVSMDITQPGPLEEWVQQSFPGDKQPDILVNNAGIGVFGPVDQIPLSDWQAMMETNINGIFYLTRLIVPLMKKNLEVCHIVNIASIAGLLGNPQMSGYNASKFAVRGFSEALFKELRFDGIKVSCMFPGSVDTQFFRKAGQSEEHSFRMRAEDVATTMIHLLETPDNMLISEITLRPLVPKR